MQYKPKAYPTKEEFIEIINLIREQQAIDKEIDQALQKVCGSFVAYGTENKYLDALLKMLEIAFNDKQNQWISWWLYESEVTDKFPDAKVITDVDGNKINLATVDVLYDFLVKEMEDIH